MSPRPSTTRRAGALASIAAAAALAAACAADDAPRLVPVIEAPPPGSEADPYPGLEEVTLELARAGEADALLSATFTRGDALVLPGVPFGEDLVVHLTGRIAGADVAYGRTCAFDLVAGEVPPAPHLYFSRNVRWAAAGAPPPAAAEARVAWSGADGSGLFAGVTGVDRFDPFTGAWEVSTSDLAARTGALGLGLPDGRGLLVGGLAPGGAPAGFFELITPTASPADRVARTDEPAVARAEAAVATQGEGAVVVLGGRVDDGLGGLVVDGGIVVLSPADGGGLVARTMDATLAVPRAGHTATRLTDSVFSPVLVVGGVGADGKPVAAAELWKPPAEALASPPGALAVPRHRHAAVRLPDGSVLVVGGLDAAGQPVRTLEIFSLGDGFRSVGQLPAGAGVIEMTLTGLPDGRLLLAGGRESDGGIAVNTVFVVRLDELDGTVDVVPIGDRLETARAGHQAALLCDGTVLVSGGVAGVMAERYAPPPLGRR